MITFPSFNCHAYRSSSMYTFIMACSSKQKPYRGLNASKTGKTAWQIFFSDHRQEMKVIRNFFQLYLKFLFWLETKS